VDAGYKAMLAAIRTERTPNLLVLQYVDAWRVKNLLIIPKVFLTESVVEKRKPLGPHARRAQWIGCNILLFNIPLDGKIAVVSEGVPAKVELVRQQFRKVQALQALEPSLRGWTVDVLRVIRRLAKAEFSLDEVYASEPELQALHPKNQNVRPKMRQQLQVLRDLGFVRFLSPGRYRILL